MTVFVPRRHFFTYVCTYRMYTAYMLAVTALGGEGPSGFDGASAGRFGLEAFLWRQHRYNTFPFGARR